MKSKIINSFLYILPSAGGVILPLITIPIFTRLIPLSDFGNLTLLQIFSTFIISFINFGLPFSFERNFFELKDIDKRISFLYTTLIFILATFFITSILISSNIENISYYITGSKSNNKLLFLTFIGTGISSFKSYFLIYFKNTENAKKYVLYTIDENLFTFIFSMIFVIIFHSGIYGIVYGQIISSTLIFFLLIYRFIKIYPIKFNIPSFKEALIISLPLTPRSIITLIGQQFDKFVVGKLETSFSVGILSFAQKISNSIFVLTTALQNVWGPIVYKLMFSNEDNANQSISKILIPFFYLSLFPALVINLFSKEIVQLLIKNIPNNTLMVRMVILFTIIQASLFFNKQNQLIFMKKTRELSILTLLTTSITVFSNLIFMYYFGLNGLMWSIFISGIFNIFFFFYRSQKAYRIIWDKKIYLTLYMFFTMASLLQIIILNCNFKIQYKISYNCFIILIYIILGINFNILNKNKLKEFINIFTINLKTFKN